MTATITRLLIANRGEIARRIMRTAHDRGIVCVAVFSEPDADEIYVAEADLAVALRGTTSAETYLDREQLLDAARVTGCDAVHPGYGFLSENAAFGQDVVDHGLIWVGPDPASIIAMSDKVRAKQLVAAAGVPLAPGAEVPETGSEAELSAAAARVGYPLLVKAAAGGGGKGMRVVNGPADLPSAVAGARREAASSFGDPTVFLERYLPAARHIEVQVFGDRHGTVRHLSERDCSIQRRHQKVVEEAPAPFLDNAIRDGLQRAAVAAASAVDYVGAGTVEFLVDGAEYYFLEMNTRLQVEHPVTEEVLGVDLVGWQFDVAEGLPLPDFDATPQGHAIEVRLYAEDPTCDDLPSTGTLTTFEVDDPLVRLETAVASGSVVSPHYDPMLAKVIAHGRDRREASSRLARALRSARIHGVTTNRDMLVAVLEHQAFRSGPPSTAFLTEHEEVRHLAPAVTVAEGHAVAAAAGVWHCLGTMVPVVAEGSAPPGWRNVVTSTGDELAFGGSGLVGLGLSGGESQVVVHHRPGRTPEWGIRRVPAGEALSDPSNIQWLPTVQVTAGVPQHLGDTRRWLLPVRVRLADGLDLRTQVTMFADGDGGIVYVDDAREHTDWQLRPRSAESDDLGAGAGPSTPVPGSITLVAVAPGDRVAAGDLLVVLEAMKMEHRIVADIDGEVAEVLVEPGDSVEAHQVVVTLSAAATEAESSETAPGPVELGADETVAGTPGGRS
jgi:acetyl/propionyl-CoA carboxylase alpha subunit